jgi:hypothetical protein
LILKCQRFGKPWEQALLIRHNVSLFFSPRYMGLILLPTCSPFVHLFLWLKQSHLQKRMEQLIFSDCFKVRTPSSAPHSRIL